MNLLTLFTEPDTNISYYVLVAAYIQNVVSGPRTELRRLGLDNNVMPREILTRLEKNGKVSPETLGRLKRRHAAQSNGWENLLMFAAAMVAGNSAGLSAKWMNNASVLYLVARILFSYLYINGTTLGVSFLRSAAFGVGAGAYLGTFIKAGLAINK